MTRLPPEIRSLCARLATERTRATTWSLAAALRREMQTRLAEGADPDALADELRHGIKLAQGAQGRVSGQARYA